MKPRLGDREGFSLAVVLLVVVLLSTLALALSTITMATRAETSMELAVDRSAFIARAGFERVCADLLMHADAWDTLGATPYTDVPFSGGSYTVTIANTAPDSCQVTVVGTYERFDRTLAFTVAREFTEGGGAGGGGSGDTEPPPGAKKVTICHLAGTPQQKTMSVAVKAWPAHQAHGDVLGSCDEIPTGDGPTTGVSVVSLSDPTVLVLAR